MKNKFHQWFKSSKNMKDELNTQKEQQEKKVAETNSEEIEIKSSEDSDDTSIDVDIEESTKKMSKKEKAKQKDLQKELEKAQKQIADLEIQLQETQAVGAKATEQYVRLSAEWENFKKRREKELSDTIKFANEDLIKKLLPIIDNFDRTLATIDKTDNLAAIKEGIELVSKSLKNQFEKVGLEPINSLGNEFNYELHEAITAIPVEEEEKKGIVLDEVEKGYKLRDKVIRFSKVVIGE